MKILFLTPQLPYPPRQGTQIRNFYLLKAIAEVHHVDLISFAREGESIETAGPLPGLCGRIELLPAPRRSGRDRLRTLTSSTDPDMAHRLPSAAFMASLRSLVGEGGYDAVQVAGIEMARYIPVVRAADPRATIVFDDHNAEYILQGRAAAVDAHYPSTWPKALYSLVQWRRLRRYEAEVCQQADAVLAVSEADAAALDALGTGARIAVVPNGVDTEYYQPISSRGKGSSGLLFTGTMDYRPNVDAMVWFVTSVLPLVVAERPEVTLTIVGRSPSPAVLRLASGNPHVIVTGPVEDVRPYFAGSPLFVVPIRMAGGARLKVLEALAMGVPVISTTIGAEGIDVVDGKEIVLADTAEDFANSILRLLEAPSLGRPFSMMGRQAAEKRFSWNQVAPRLLDVYRALEISRRGDGGTGRRGEEGQGSGVKGQGKEWAGNGDGVDG